MRIAVLGSGLMGSALGTLWGHTGHRVAFSYSRDRAKLETLAHDAGNDAVAAAPREAVAACEIVLVSVPWHRIDDALSAAGGPDVFAKKVVITCSLPMLPDDSDLALAHETSGAEELARRLPKARIVAAFNTIPSELLRADLIDAATEKFGRPQVVLSGDDVEAKIVVRHLADDIGFMAIDAGPLRVSRWMEPFGLLVGQLAYAQDRGPELGYRFIEGGTLRAAAASTPRRPEYTIVSEYDPVDAWIIAYGAPDLDRQGTSFKEFQKDAMRWLSHGVTIGGVIPIDQAGAHRQIISFTIGQDQRPEPFEHILEWLRGHPLVRMIEVEYHTLKGGPADSR